MTSFEAFKISIAKTDVFAIECLDQLKSKYTWLVVRFRISWAENLRTNFWLTKSRQTVQTDNSHFQVRGHKNPAMLMLRYDGKGQ